MRHFLVFRYAEEARLAPSWAAAGVAGRGLEVEKRAAPTKPVGCTIEGGKKPKEKFWLGLWKKAKARHFVARF